jgi:hypothetical protein
MLTERDVKSEKNEWLICDSAMLIVQKTRRIHAPSFC